MNFNPRYYTVDRLSPAGLWLINDRLKTLLREYNIKDYPIDSFRLVDKISAHGKIRITIKFNNDFSGGFDGATLYFPDIDEYLIILPGKGKLPFRYSKGRRLNFTLGHELGHIFLDHMIAGRQYKRASLEEAENLEADEFAGRLLMPEKLLLHSNFTSEQDVSLEYLVSDQALYKRLNNLKRLDLYRVKPISTCSVCGYSDITPMASYCSICGQELSSRHRNGIRKIEYPAPLANEKQRVTLCVICGNEEISHNADFCRICGTSLYNACVGDTKIWGCSHINAPNARHCEICGAATEYANRGVFGKWQDERDDYIRAMTHR